MLDEATSELDSQSKKLVQNSPETVVQGRTVILIAHKLSTIVNVDLIVVVDNGKVNELGKYHDLLDGSKLYNNLVNIQNIIV